MLCTCPASPPAGHPRVLYKLTHVLGVLGGLIAVLPPCHSVCLISPITSDPTTLPPISPTVSIPTTSAGRAAGGPPPKPGGPPPKPGAAPPPKPGGPPPKPGAPPPAAPPKTRENYFEDVGPAQNIAATGDGGKGFCDNFWNDKVSASMPDYVLSQLRAVAFSRYPSPSYHDLPNPSPAPGYPTPLTADPFPARTAVRRTS